MPCAECTSVQSFFDGELDPDSVRRLEQHLPGCDECTRLLGDLEQIRSRLKDDLPPYAASPELRARIQRALDRDDGSSRQPVKRTTRRVWHLPPFWWGGLSGAGATLFAGVLAFFLLTVATTGPVVDGVLEAHVSSLSSAHLTDVVSTDRHTVKPWFAGRVDVSPAVADFAPQGYRLLGGRVDQLAHQRAAVLVYEHGPHVINVFCWIAPHGPLPRSTTRHGYHLAFWEAGDLAYAAVSDAGWDELTRLENLLRGLGPMDSPPQNSSPPKE